MKKIFYLLLIIIFFNANFLYAEQEFKKLRIGYKKDTFSEVIFDDFKFAMKFYVEKLYSKKLHRVAAPFLYEDLDAVDKAIFNKELDMINIYAEDYLKMKAKNQLVPFIIPMIGDDVLEYFVLAVRKDSNINSLKDLKGKKIIIDRGRKGNIGIIWLDTILMRADLRESDKFFNKVDNVKKISEAIYPVFFKQADACIITQKEMNLIEELNPQIGNEIKILEKSKGFIFLLSFLTKEITKEEIIKFTQVACSMHEAESGSQMLEFFYADKIVTYKDEYMKNVVDIVSEYEKLKSK